MIALKQIALAAIKEAQASGRWKSPIVTTVEPVKNWTLAEGYHQDYYLKNPIRYKYYRTSCGRDARVNEVWGKKD